MAITYENFHKHLEQKQGSKTKGRSITPNDTLKRLHDDFIFEAEELKKLYPIVDNSSWREYSTETVIDACGNNVILPK